MPNLSSRGLIDALSFSGRQLHLDNKPPLGTIHNPTTILHHIRASEIVMIIAIFAMQVD